MTALSAPRNPEMLQTGNRYWRTFPVLADAVIYPGALVCLTAAGFLTPGATALDLTAVGFATPKAQQLDAGVLDATGEASGDSECEVDSGIGLLKNSADALEVTIAHVGQDCYIVDDQTVAATSGAVAGTAQVTRGDVVFNGTDLVGLAVDDLPDLTVASNTSDDQTAADLRDAWNASAQHLAAAVASIDTDDAESWIILAFTDGGAAAHTVAAVSPATADVVTITNTATAVAPTAATRSRAGKVWQVDARGVYVAVGTT